MRPVRFLDCGIQSGQVHEGLKYSPRIGRALVSSLFQVEDVPIDLPYRFHRKIVAESDLDSDFLRPYEQLRDVAADSYHPDRILVNWGGDHSIAVSTIDAFLHKHPDGKVLWIDAHADCNVPQESPTGNFHGMPLAMLLGLFHDSHRFLRSKLSPEKIFLFGVRDLDPFEIKTVRDLKIRTLSPVNYRFNGLLTSHSQIIKWIGKSPLHISFDIDAIDPKFAPSTGVKVGNGLIPKEVANLFTLIRLSGIRVPSIDVVEVNPLLGTATQLESTLAVVEMLLEALVSAENPALTNFAGSIHGVLS